MRDQSGEDRIYAVASERPRDLPRVSLIEEVTSGRVEAGTDSVLDAAATESLRLQILEGPLARPETKMLCGEVHSLVREIYGCNASAEARP